MESWIRTEYGNHEKLYKSVEPIPVPTKNQVLIKIKACGLNASDIEFLTGKPSYVPLMNGLKHKTLGSDIAGVVVKVGELAQFKIGDEVFGDVLETYGGFAEYCIAQDHQIIKKPLDLSFEQVACIPQSSIIALQSLQKTRVKENEEILIIGAGGGGGSFAIQLSQMLGSSKITCIDSKEKEGYLVEMGAIKTIDYKTEKISGLYDVIIDFIGTMAAYKYSEYLKPKGRFVMVGGSTSVLLTTLVTSPFMSFSGKEYGILVHEPNQKDLQYIVDLVLSGKLKVKIGAVFKSEDTPKAVEALMSGTIGGKIVIVRD